MRGQNGITIVALIITVIIMLILTGVVINGITKENGLIKGTNEAVILSSLKEVDEALNEYSTKQAGKKIRQGDYSGEMNMQELVDLGILKKIEVGDTLRTIGIIQDLKKIGIKGKLGKGAKKIEQDNINTLSEISDVYAIDFEDNMLYYIKGDVWSITGTKTIREINQVALEKKKFITTWEVGEGESIVLPIIQNNKLTYNCEVEIIYEDENKNQTLEQKLNIKDNIKDENGNNIKLTAEEFKNIRTITFNNTGKYIIKINGVCDFFSFDSVYGITTSKDNITEIIQWGDVQFGGENLYGRVIFYNCANLRGNIPSPSEKSFKNIHSFASFFKNCKNLTGSIPKDLFRGCINAKNFDGAFYGCSGLTGNIPEGLFDDCPNIENLGKGRNGTFYGCSGLTGEIPKGLFKNKPNLTYLSHTFSECSGLIGNIPEDLLENCPNIEIVEGIFSKCSNISGISKNLFNNNNGENNKITAMWGAFERCSSIKEIPEGLFDKCTEVKKFGVTGWGYGGIFEYCTTLTTIPENLFINCTKAEDFARAFCHCTNVVQIPENLFYTNSKNGEEVAISVSFRKSFSSCTNLQTVPENLFANCTNAKDFEYVFGGCSNLEIVPEKLFAECPNAQNFRWVFWQCKNLKEIPYNLFANCPEITSFASAFTYCSSLTGTVPELWNKTDTTKPCYTQVTAYDSCFSGTPAAIRAQVPTEWGGTNTDIVIE